MVHKGFEDDLTRLFCSKLEYIMQANRIIDEKKSKAPEIKALLKMVPEVP